MAAGNSAKRLLATLYNQLNRAANNCQDDAKSLDPDSLWLAQTYLPLVVDDWLQAIPTASEVVAQIKIPGWRTFERMIRDMPQSAVAKLLGVMVAMLATGGLEVAIGRRVEKLHMRWLPCSAIPFISSKISDYPP